MPSHARETARTPQIAARCCRCAELFPLNPDHRVAVCPHCGVRMGTRDVELRGDFASPELRTLGTVTVTPSGNATLRLIEATGGVVVRGTLLADVSTAGTFAVDAGGRFVGTGRAKRLRIDPAALVEGELVTRATD